MSMEIFFLLFFKLAFGNQTEDGNLSYTVLDLPAYAGLIVQPPSEVVYLPRKPVRQNFVNATGRLLRVVTMREPPFVEYYNITNGTMHFNNKTGPGVVVEILQEVAARINAKLEYFEADDDQWGEEISEGLWTGVVGMLQRKEKDLLAAATILRYDRHLVIDQSYPFFTSETGMLIRSPGQGVDNPFLIVTAPFRWEVWALTALTIFVSGCIMKALCRSLQIASEVQYTWLESVWMFFSVFVQQGLPIQPRSWTCRTMLAFWWLAALTLVATFTGNMVALFAVNKAAFPFNNQDELAHHVEYEGYKIVTPNNTLTRIKFMQTSNLGVFRKLWHEMSAKNKWINVSTIEDGIELVKSQPKLVLLGPMETLQMYAASDCLLATTSNGILPVMYSIALQKQSPYTELISNTSRQLVEMGLIAKWMKDYHFAFSSERGNLCIFAEGVSAAGEAINIPKAQGAFWILLAGTVLGFGGIALEHAAKLLALCLKSMGISLKRCLNLERGGTLELDRRQDQYAGRSEVFRALEQPTESSRAYQPIARNSFSFDGKLKFRGKTSDRSVWM